MPSIDQNHISLFFESGSTLAYVADEAGPGLSQARALDGTGLPHIGASTNNVLAYLILWLKHRIPCTLFPWGTPETTYGASLGCLAIDLARDQKPQYPPGKLNPIERSEIAKLKDSCRSVPRWGRNTLLLGALSGLQMTDRFSLKAPALVTDQIRRCRGPHVGSYKNKLFKRFTYETNLPLMMFLTSDKIDCEIEVGKCHFVLDDANAWKKFMNTQPLAFCVGCRCDEYDKYVSIFRRFGFAEKSLNDVSRCTAFVARNEQFVRQFEEPNDI